MSSFEGYLDFYDDKIISGWAWNKEEPDKPVDLDIYDYEKKIDTIRADRFRDDLLLAGKGDGKHGFIFFIPNYLKNNKNHLISVKGKDNALNINNSPVSFKYDNIYDTVIFEISGLCNAKCPWCANGRGYLNQAPSRFIPPNEFKEAIEKLFDESLINENTSFKLFNYGEPLLHPSLDEILEILIEKKLKYIISTNASKYIELNRYFLENLECIYISIPGFSQKSYDKIHGFNFEKILENIDKWIELVGHEKIQIQYHENYYNPNF